MTRTKLESEAYFNWLWDIVGEPRQHETHEDLLSILFKKDYVYTNKFDADRAADGLELRARYFNSHEIEPPLGKCCMFEMLVALSFRMAFIAGESEDEAKKWFWEMIHNIGLDEWKDQDMYYIYEYEKQIMDRLDDISDNYVLLFPVTGVSKIPRVSHLWTYMNQYIIERMDS